MQTPHRRGDGRGNHNYIPRRGHGDDARDGYDDNRNRTLRNVRDGDGVRDYGCGRGNRRYILHRASDDARGGDAHGAPSPAHFLKSLYFRFAP